MGPGVCDFKMQWTRKSLHLHLHSREGVLILLANIQGVVTDNYPQLPSLREISLENYKFNPFGNNFVCAR